MAGFSVKARVKSLVPQGDQTQVTFEANYGLGTGNEEWAKYTPWLEYRQSVRTDLVEKLGMREGQAYTAVFTPDEPAETALGE